MRILHLSPVFDPYKGGYVTAAREEARVAASLGHEVRLITSLFNRSWKAVEEVQGFEVHRIKPLISSGQGAILTGLGSFLKWADIVHLHYPAYGIAESYWWYSACLRSGHASLILQIHMDTPGLKGIRKVLQIPSMLLKLELFRRASRILTASLDYSQNSSLARYIPKLEHKLLELPYGIDTTRFAPRDAPRTMRDRFSLSRDEVPVILFVGGLDRAHYFKGIHILIQALAKVEEPFYLVVVGDGDLREEYEALARSLGLQDRIRFAGRVEDFELPLCYNIADLLVLPSTDMSEAFGIVLLEAQSSGVPVIASNLPGVRTVLKAGETGLLAVTGDVDDLSEKISCLIGNRTLREQFAVASRKRAQMTYDWSIIGEKLILAYEDVLQGRSL